MSEPYKELITSDVSIYTTEKQVWLKMGATTILLAESPVRLKLGCDLLLTLPDDNIEYVDD